MLDQLQLTIRQYERIVPQSKSQMNRFEADQIYDWLERQVGRITAMLWERPEFRRQACWPMDQLLSGRQTVARDAVLAVECSVLNLARGLRLALQAESFLRELSRWDENPTQWSDQLTWIAGRPWRDLVNEGDYFGSSSQLNLCEPTPTRWEMFSPFCNRLLREPGDYVTRYLRIRVEFWSDLLGNIYSRWRQIRHQAGHDLGIDWDGLGQLHATLQSKIEEFRQRCVFDKAARLADSCAVLLQIELGFHPRTNVDWLGPVAKMAPAVADLPYRVRRNQWEIPERAVAALVEISDMVQRRDPADVIEEMRRTKRLVLIEEQRTGYFEGNSIVAEPTCWHGPNSLGWELLWSLADRALVRRFVDPDCLSNPKAERCQVPPTAQAVKDRRFNLRKLIVGELNGLIVDCGIGAYRLNLEPDEICLLGWKCEERLEILEPQVPRAQSIAHLLS